MTTMHGWYVREFGGLDAMRWEALPIPEPAAGQLRVRVRASGINFAETRMRAGTYSGQELPFTMGMECAGTVDALGDGVSGWRVGDRVFGRARGAHAEYVLIDAPHALPMPAALDWVEAAAVPVGWLTAWHALVTLADVAPRSRVLIEAVASSVGSAALQIAKWRGCWVAGTASLDAKLERAREWGADAVYNYRTEDVAARVRSETDGHGVDVGLMTIGEETAQALFDAMAMEGRIVMYGSTGGRQVCFSLNIGTRNLSLQSMSISTSTRFLPETMATFRATALPLLADGTFRPVVDVVLPITELPQAHRRVDSRTHFGKIVLTVP
jgi:NADPH:quinone reductase-like Zn-dependent oxidoreductase